MKPLKISNYLIDIHGQLLKNYPKLDWEGTSTRELAELFGGVSSQGWKIKRYHMEVYLLEQMEKAKNQEPEAKQEIQKEQPKGAETGISSVDTSKQKIETTYENDYLDMVHNSMGQRVKSLSDLLEVTKTDLNIWEVVAHTVNTWEQAQADKESGEPKIVTLHQVKARMQRKLIEQLKPPSEIILNPPRGETGSPKGMKKVLFVPDTQHGHIWNEEFTQLEPLHDRKALDCVIQLANDWKPDVIVLLGDMLDLAQWSLKFPRPPTVRQTTQVTLNELYYDLCRFRNACPDAEMIWLEGNHEIRIQKALQDLMPEALTLRPVGTKNPVLSIEHLLHLDQLRINYVKPYPADFWLWDCIQICHGEGHTKGVTTKLAQKKSYSMVKGHGHTLESACGRVETPNGPRTITIMQPGCLCRTDGAVPGVTPRPNWQHGLGMGVLIDGQEHLWSQPILDGKLFFQDKIFVGQEDREFLAQQLGVKQIAGL